MAGALPCRNLPTRRESVMPAVENSGRSEVAKPQAAPSFPESWERRLHGGAAEVGECRKRGRTCRDPADGIRPARKGDALRRDILACRDDFTLRVQLRKRGPAR